MRVVLELGVKRLRTAASTHGAKMRSKAKVERWGGKKSQESKPAVLEAAGERRKEKQRKKVGRRKRRK